MHIFYGGNDMTQMELDCKGLPCPQPVLRCKQCIEESGAQVFTVLLDNDAAKENVSRFLGTKGYEASAEKSGDGLWRLTATSRNATAAPQAAPQENPADTAAAQEKICVFISSRFLGSGDDELGEKLMGNFIATLPELGDELWRIILVNGAVVLATEDGPALESLKKMEKDGISILVCGTCLDFFHLLEKKQIGETTNMLDVVTSLQLATKVIRP